jgi:CRP/FNR family cyclic AMP-dependent transcriptional regulator
MQQQRHHSKLWYLEGFDLFQKMTPKEIESVEQVMHLRHLKKNAILRFPQILNKYVYLLKEGVIKIAMMNEDGKEFIKYLIKPGNLFGEIPLLGDVENSEEYGVALEDSTVCFMDTEKMKQWMLENADLRTEIFKQIGTRIKKVENRLLSMFFKDAPSRIREFIADFVKEFGKESPDGYEAKNFLTHEDIAKLTATSRQTVSTTMNELREQGLIEYNTKIIKIPKTSALLASHVNPR